MLSIGLMSGTSLDGIDCALLDTDGKNYAKVLRHFYHPYSQEIIHLLKSCIETQQVDAKVIWLLTEEHIYATKKLLEKLEIEDHLKAKSGGPFFELNQPSDLKVKMKECTYQYMTESESCEITKDHLKTKGGIVVGFHGQTISHNPKIGNTWQIGDAQLLADQLNMPVIFDFRRNDMAHGGQGAPLVPIYHKILAQNLPKPCVILNIGGVSNLTYISDSGIEPESSEITKDYLRAKTKPCSELNQSSNFRPRASECTDEYMIEPESSEITKDHLRAEHGIIAFDTGPGNALINDIVHTQGMDFDKDGQIAMFGTIDYAWVNQVLRDPYFSKPYPKSLDRNYFKHYLRDIEKGACFEDQVATISFLTVKTIEKAIETLPKTPKAVYLCGGGSKNKFLTFHLSKFIECHILDNSDFIEAEAFAFLAVRSVEGLPLSFPLTTGVKWPVSGGQLFAPYSDGLEKK